MTHRDGTDEPGGADEVAAARDALGGRHDPLDGRTGAGAPRPPAEVSEHDDAAPGSPRNSRLDR